MSSSSLWRLRAISFALVVGSTQCIQDPRIDDESAFLQVSRSVFQDRTFHRNGSKAAAVASAAYESADGAAGGLRGADLPRATGAPSGAELARRFFAAAAAPGVASNAAAVAAGFKGLIKHSAQAAAVAGERAAAVRAALAHTVDPEHFAASGPLYRNPHMHVPKRTHEGRTRSHHSETPSLPAAPAPFAGSAGLGTLGVAYDERIVLTSAGFFLVLMSVLVHLQQKAHGKKQAVVVSTSHSCTCSKALTTWDGTVATFSSIVGMGVLSMPYALSLAGMCGVALIFFFVCCSAYTAHLLTRALLSQAEKARTHIGARPVVLGWNSLVSETLGPRAARFVDLLVTVELWGAVLSGIVISAMNLNQLVDLSMPSAIALYVVCVYLLSCVPASVLTRVNVLSNVLFLACCGMFVLTGLLLPARAPASDIQVLRPRGILAAAGIFVFSPASHSVYPGILQRMEEPRRYPVCLRRAYIAAFAFYVAVAVPGYWLFGSAVQPSAVRNIGVDLHLVSLPGMGWMSTLAAGCMVVKLSATNPLFLSSLTSTVEGMLRKHLGDMVSDVMVGPTVLTLSAVVALHFAHNLGSLINMVGSVFCMNIAFVVPVLCYWKLKYDSVGCMQVAFFSSLLLMGTTFASLGLITALDIL